MIRIKKKKIIHTIWLTSVTLSAVLTFTFLFLFLLKSKNPFSINSDIDTATFGQYGDLIGGLVGTLLAGLSVYLLYETYKSQKAELKATKNALYDQKDETAIFNMLSTLRDIVKDMKGSIPFRTPKGHTELKELVGREYFHEATKLFRENFSYEELDHDLMYNPATHKLHHYNEERTGERNEHGNEAVRKIPIQDPAIEVEDTLGEIITGFENQFNTYQHNFDHYFRYVRNIIEFIETIKVNQYKNQYIKILKAQLSLDEKVLIFYYTLTVREDPLFQHNVDSSGILSDINHRKQLFDDWHHLHYPLTDFKSLSEKELDEKNKYLRWKSKASKKRNK